MRFAKIVHVWKLIAMLLLFSGCADQGAATRQMEEQQAFDEDMKRVRQNEYDDRAADAEATSRAKYDEEMEIEAWNTHLEELQAEGQNAAEDPSVNRDPSYVDCEDFDFQEEAVAFFWGAGGPNMNLFWLDDDRDEIPCELLPRWQPGVDWHVN